jgi:hypothetical protein
VDLLININILKKHMVSIFRDHLVMLGSGEIYIGSEEEQAKGDGPIRVEKRPNRKCPSKVTENMATSGDWEFYCAKSGHSSDN